MKLNFKFQKNIKAQAALEFLTTYGWAFLIIIIMIGSLAYFGILSPSKLLPNRCNFGAEFQCIDYQISGTGGTFKMRLKNGVGEAIDVSSMTISTEASAALSCTAPAVPTSWKSSEIRDLTWTSCTFPGLVVGEKGKILAAITYNSVISGPSYGKQAKGEVFSTVI